MSEPHSPAADGDAQLREVVRQRLNTPLIGDILDQLGRVSQFLPQEISPMRPGMMVVGRAMPVLVADVFGHQERPYGLLTEALDQLENGEIYIATGGRALAAAWGELLTVSARLRGAMGAVIDGFHRDTPKVLDLDWPVFSRGAYGQDAGPRASVAQIRVSVSIGGVNVAPGDLVVGDVDGVVVVPRAVEDEVMERALAKAADENVVRTAIENGMTATAAFDKYGVL